MALPTSFLASWFFTPDTKLGLYFNGFGLGAQDNILTAIGYNGVDFSNGMGASLEEDYHIENQITRHPVENTPAISDHIILQPTTVTITGLLTSILPITFGGLSFSQLGNATQTLIKMARVNSGISLTTGLLYGSKYLRLNNLAVRSLEIPRNNNYGRTSIKFTMTLEQLIITTKNASVTSSSFSQAKEADGVDIQ